MEVTIRVNDKVFFARLIVDLKEKIIIPKGVSLFVAIRISDSSAPTVAPKSDDPEVIEIHCKSDRLDRSAFIRSLETLIQGYRDKKRRAEVFVPQGRPSFRP